MKPPAGILPQYFTWTRAQSEMRAKVPRVTSHQTVSRRMCSPTFILRQHDFYRDVHARESAGMARPSTGERRGFVGIAGDGDGDVVRAGEFVIGRIESTPARAGDIDFRPGMGGTVLG